MRDSLDAYKDEITGFLWDPEANRIILELWYQVSSLPPSPRLDRTVLLADIQVCSGDIVLQEIRRVGYVQWVKSGQLEKWQQAGCEIIYSMREEVNNYETMVDSSVGNSGSARHSLAGSAVG